MWNQAGEDFPSFHKLQAEVVLSDSNAVVWRGAEELRKHQRGMNVWAPLLATQSSSKHRRCPQRKNQTLLHRIPLIEDVWSTWSILVHCAVARTNYVARVVEPLTTRQFCERHDIGLRRCLCAVVQISPEQPEDVVEAALLPMMLGGVGLRSVVWVKEPAYWASWMGTMPVIRKLATLRLQKSWLP